MQTSICVRTHIAKTWYFMPSIYRHLFDSIPPPPFSAGWHGGCYREKFFIFSESIINSFWLYFDSDFIFSFLLFDFYSYFIFLFFRFSFWLSNINYRFDSHTSFAWYLLVWFRYIFLDYNFGFCVFRLIFTRWILLASISTCFSIADSTLWLFNSLSL